ncbi:D-alanyl-D-alanine carboxypeptidase family protein [Marinomonas mediterranea]|jgi:penicillin-binding protein 6. Serine peptidase. MEROPS family S11|uniref:serine-type D-Ala-D-Ala carboxypeptidase n=1 Tax=Marinomonas mediterranea (strain ATCC 700492 / JCM 21426 / NBRC 103028 / MMB-1) TaxID=717774 RepID=F2JY10_MARM1|nr:D-alanyl-D-alanine carboxypeptidase family protein [Marinomonas mediterranea]ADZ90746.1 Beta-lactamase [Marinomonas mediterranea MMB-1]WCN08788.1 serine-type D-Ala-D-Ala carboxypeptidase [Marinomonas mediterranea]WCN12834.1 serine-type D-Ala-D-Ala carboxypeptidase [Marinomonas mediterranea]WCN16901.1 serine-type D-Ala-D-Ala carboxypeptidase [Marinomonas mediterranea MMB-1]
MKRLIGILLVFTSLFSIEVNAAPSLIPAPPQLSASSYILMDAYTGEVLVEQNSHKELPPASLTKLMTAYIADYEIARGNISYDDQVRVSEAAWRMKGSRMFIREGTRVKLEDLMRGIIIQSGNDASVAVAEHIAGAEGAFVDLMNQHAQLLGMKNTHFQNSTGFPAENHYSSAYDIALLSRAKILQFPESYKMYAEKYFTYNDIRQPNRNKLLWRDKTVDGLKTGHTQAAGYCLAASAVRNGTRLISVVMGTSSDEARATESQKLMNYGFRYYETRKLYSAGQVVNNAHVWGGATDSVKVGFTDDVLVTMPRQQADSIPATLDLAPVIEAPISAGDVLGKVIVGQEGNVLLEREVVALESVEEGGFFKRLFDKIKRFFMNLF